MLRKIHKMDRDKDFFWNAKAAPPGVHKKAVEILKKVPPGRILDAPAGEGVLSQRLKELGFKVLAADLDPFKFKAKGIEIKKVDLNGPLPYQENLFDYVVCIEGIEHLENPYHLIKGFRRVLKANGLLLLSTPNTLSVYSRLRYLLFGWPDPWPPDYHINPIGWIELRRILEKGGFVIEEIFTNRSMLSYPYAHRGRFYLRLIAPIIFFLVSVVIVLVTKIYKRHSSISPLLSRELLWGEALIIKAKAV